jgi:ribosome-binding factor A
MNEDAYYRYFYPMESERQRKVASVIQRDLADIFRKSTSEYPGRGLIISVSAVKVAVDMAIAKVYLSIFPPDEAKSVLEGITSNAPLIKHELAQRTKNQMRRAPELLFYIDDSIDLAEKVERSLKGADNPIQDPSLLIRRMKK